MKKQVKALLSALTLLNAVVATYAQDDITLINGERIEGKVLRQSPALITYMSDTGIESDIDRQLVATVRLGNGKIIDFNPGRSMGFEYDTELVVLENTASLEISFQQTFKKCVRREYTLYFDNLRNEVSNQLFLTSIEHDKNQFTKEQLRACRALRYYAYVTNAFAALVNTTGDKTKVVLFSNSIDKPTIDSYLANKTFKLVDSNAKSPLREMLDEKLKSFSMKFLSSGVCLFHEENENPQTLYYEVSSDGKISFWEGAKKSRATTYDIVFIDKSIMRYTRFFKGADQDLVTRKVQVVEGE